ncbi:MAG: aspartate kinase [Rikenellaceae bacterium]|jgi:aspartate kinase|nr:aspartate kinase [Rikenellaceae bacterium]
MIVYKFGGASVNAPEGVRNLARIVALSADRLLVIVSAMGKTTNGLEEVLENMVAGQRQAALDRFAQIEQYHNGIVEGLFGPGARIEAVQRIYDSARAMIGACGAAAEDFPAEEAGSGSGVLCATPLAISAHEYDRLYDALASCGELLSTTIISEFLRREGIDNTWLDMRECFITDERHRAADVLLDQAGPRLQAAVAASPERVLVGQGFIGATAGGETTTLGREGSDYSAAVAANILDASQVVIWKDVPGILNADPRLFPDTLLIPELTYLDAIELAYSGAQVIHPKTIKPLQNKQIPLYVRPFSDPAATGSVIKGQMQDSIEVPILILKKGQVLVSVRPRDFSFVLEDRLLDVLRMFDDNGVKINLIQTSAVNLSLCVDAGRTLAAVIEQLHKEFRVVYNDSLELLTIRGYTPELYDRHAGAEGVYVSQRTRRIVRIVRGQMQ